MTFNLVPWIVVWALITAVTLVLVLYRRSMDPEESLDIHLGSLSTQEAQAMTTLSKKVARVEFWGKSMTVLSVVVGLFVLVLWGYNQVLLSHQPLQ